MLIYKLLRNTPTAPLLNNGFYSLFECLKMNLFIFSKPKLMFLFGSMWQSPQGWWMANCKSEGRPLKSPIPSHIKDPLSIPINTNMSL